jgi:hypothetical protein
MRWRGATCTGFTWPGCAASSGFLSLLTLSSPRNPAGLVSYRRRSWGSPFRGFPFRLPGRLSTPLAPPGFVVDGCARQPSEPAPFPRHRPACGPRSEEQLRRRPQGRGWFRACLQGFQPGRKSVLRSAGVSPHDGSRSSPGFQPSRGLSLPALTRPMPRLPSCASLSACRNRPSAALQGFNRREVG